MIIKEEQSLKEMAKIGSIDKQVGKTGGYEIWIYTNDPGNKPHFHIVNEEKNFSCCVRIDVAEYFIHLGKEDTLNSALKKSLVYFLKSKHRKLPITNWEYLCACWEDNNSTMPLDDDLQMPNYLEL